MQKMKCILEIRDECLNDSKQELSLLVPYIPWLNCTSATLGGNYYSSHFCVFATTKKINLSNPKAYTCFGTVLSSLSETPFRSSCVFLKYRYISSMQKTKWLCGSLLRLTLAKPWLHALLPTRVILKGFPSGIKVELPQYCFSSCFHFQVHSALMHSILIIGF